MEVFVGAPPWLGAFETDFPGPGTLCVFNDPERARAMQERATFAAPSARLVATHGIRLQARTRDRGPRKFHLGPARSHDRGSRIADRGALTIRVPPQASWIGTFKRAGAAATPLPRSDTVIGLQQRILGSSEQAPDRFYAPEKHAVATNLARTRPPSPALDRLMEPVRMALGIAVLAVIA